MKSYEVFDLAHGKTYAFMSDVDKRDALVTVYLMETNRASQISNVALRDDLKARIHEGVRSLGLSNFAVLKYSYTDEA